MSGALKAAVKTSAEVTHVELPRAAGLKAGELSAVCYGAEGLLLLNEAVAPDGYFAGSLRSVALGEVFSHVISGIRSGKLVVSARGARKTVTFRDAQILFATSTEPHERFGRKLVRLGLIQKEQLDEALAAVKPGAKLGQVLKKKGWVTASSLYAAMTELVREIVLNLFELTEGDFLFLEGAGAGEDAVKLPGKVRDLVLDGVKRAEAVQLWRSKLPGAMRVVLEGEPNTPDEAQLFSHFGQGQGQGQGASLDALRAAFEGSDFAFLSCVSGAQARGALKAEPVGPPKPAASATGTPLPPSASSPLERYGALVQAICAALLKAGQPLTDLKSFLSDPLPGMERSFEGVSLSDDGKMDLTRVMQNATRADPKLGRVKAYEALESFVSYALFSAKNALSAELAESLSRDFRKLQEGAA